MGDAFGFKILPQRFGDIAGAVTRQQPEKMPYAGIIYAGEANGRFILKINEKLGLYMRIIPVLSLLGHNKCLELFSGKTEGIVQDISTGD